jgi:signal peptidase I
VRRPNHRTGFAETMPEPPTIKDSTARHLREGLRDLLLASTVVLFLIIFLVQPVRVEGTSMQPQLEDQERVFVSKITYSVFDIQRGDVVVFYFPGDPKKSFIKRVVGLPGEMIQIVNGKVLVDGQILPEPYVTADFFDDSSFGPQHVPKESFFVLGDHRNVSNDSRHWGCVPRSSIFGKAILKYWPPDDIGLIY